MFNYFLSAIIFVLLCAQFLYYKNQINQDREKLENILYDIEKIENQVSTTQDDLDKKYQQITKKSTNYVKKLTFENENQILKDKLIKIENLLLNQYKEKIVIKNFSEIKNKENFKYFKNCCIHIHNQTTKINIFREKCYIHNNFVDNKTVFLELNKNQEQCENSIVY